MRRKGWSIRGKRLSHAEKRLEYPEKVYVIYRRIERRA